MENGVWEMELQCPFLQIGSTLKTITTPLWCKAQKCNIAEQRNQAADSPHTRQGALSSKTPLHLHTARTRSDCKVKQLDNWFTACKPDYTVNTRNKIQTTHQTQETKSQPINQAATESRLTPNHT